MSIEIKSMTLGIAATNTYLVADTASGDAILIDPVDEADRIVQAAENAGWTIKLILATHGHFDHVLASKPLKDQTGAPFYIHHNGTMWLDSLPQQGLMFTGALFPEAAKPDRLLTDGPETIEVGGIRLETLYTPGHAADHLAYYLRDHKVLFGGDCLFAGSIGRTDLPGGDYAQLMRTITRIILPLGDDVQVLPGHMQTTTIGQESRINPFIREYLS